MNASSPTKASTGRSPDIPRCSYLGEGDPKEFRDTKGHDADLYEDICFRMIESGVMPCPDALEPWFVCAAHNDEDVAEALQVFEASLEGALTDR